MSYEMLPQPPSVKMNVLIIEQEGEKFAIPISANTDNGGTVDWNIVQNKPMEFPPSGHTHVCDDITDLEERLATVACNGEITVTGKSAYQSWLEQPGNAGKTETEFVESLKGPQGPKGGTGDTGAIGPQGPPGECNCDAFAPMFGSIAAFDAETNLATVHLLDATGQPGTETVENVLILAITYK